MTQTELKLINRDIRLSYKSLKHFTMSCSFSYDYAYWYFDSMKLLSIVSNYNLMKYGDYFSIVRLNDYYKQELRHMIYTRLEYLMH